MTNTQNPNSEMNPVQPDNPGLSQQSNDSSMADPSTHSSNNPTIPDSFPNPSIPNSVSPSPDSTHSSNNPTIHSFPPSASSDPDEINLLEYIYVLVKHKWWIIGATVLGLVIGYFAAKIKGPTYVAEVVIAAKEAETQKTPNLSALGGFGGILASQLNIAGSPGLDKIETILNSRKFSADLIERYDLLPEIYKKEWPKEYRTWYDTTAQSWRPGFPPPKMLSMGNFIKSEYLKREIVDGNLMTLKIVSSDSTFSDTLMAKYLEYLDYYIKLTVQTEGRENVAYLENQLISISDPLLREKLQAMIASEMEKAMLVSKEAYRIIDPPIRNRQFKEKKIYPLVFGAGLFFATVFCAILIHAFGSAQKTEEDKKLIAGIKRELLRGPIGQKRPTDKPNHR